MDGSCTETLVPTETLHLFYKIFTEQNCVAHERFIGEGLGRDEIVNYIIRKFPLVISLWRSRTMSDVIFILTQGSLRSMVEERDGGIANTNRLLTKSLTFLL